MQRSTERILLALLLSLTAVYAIAEEVTLTTYYPSPRGVYQELRAMGNLGVGTMTPQEELHVAGNQNDREGVLVTNATTGNNASATLQFGDGTNPPLLSLGLDRRPPNPVSGTEPFLWVGDNSDLRFGVNGPPNREVMRLTRSADVGIGIANPAARLDVFGDGNTFVDFRVNGRMKTGDANNAGGVWLDGAETMFVGARDANSLGFWTSGQLWNTFSISKTTGNIGIGVAPAAAGGAKLLVSGKLTTTNLAVTNNAAITNSLTVGPNVTALARVQVGAGVRNNFSYSVAGSIPAESVFVRGTVALGQGLDFWGRGLAYSAFPGYQVRLDGPAALTHLGQVRVETLDVAGEVRGGGVRGMLFGGSYDIRCDGSKNWNANPLTGGFSCPAGFAAYLMFKAEGPSDDVGYDRCLWGCYR